MAGGDTAARRRNRTRAHGQRRLRLTPRFSDTEICELEQAAEKAGLTPTGFAAQAAVAAARAGATPHLNALRGAVAELVAARTAVNRVGTNLNQAVAALNATGEAPAWLQAVAELCGRTVDAADDAIGQLRKAIPR